MTSDHSQKMPRLPTRDAESHKGDYGRVLLIGGSLGMVGAAGLAGIAALRSGAGLVTVATPASCLATVASFEPSIMTKPLDEDASGRIALSARSTLQELAEQATVVACGPGLGRSVELTQLVRSLYETLPCPAIFDADALFALAADGGPPSAPHAARIVTPHLGEFRRLIADQSLSSDASRTKALEYAARWKNIVVLKGPRTLVTDGQRHAMNATGNPGMATGGSGDVLTGVLAGLLAQGLDAFSAAHLGVHVHGLAGDLAADELGQVSMIASDLNRFLPTALQRMDPR